MIKRALVLVAIMALGAGSAWGYSVGSDLVNRIEATETKFARLQAELEKAQKRIKEFESTTIKSSSFDELSQRVQALEGREPVVQRITTQTQVPAKVDLSSVEGRLRYLEGCISEIIRKYNKHRHYINQEYSPPGFYTNPPQGFEDTIFCP